MKFGIGLKLAVVCLSFALPIGVLISLMTKAKEKDIDFAAMELQGDAYQRPLERALFAISRHRIATLRGKLGDKGQEGDAAKASSDMDVALRDLRAADDKHGTALQFTPEGLKTRKRSEFTASELEKKWKAHLAGLPSQTDIDKLQSSYADLIAHVRTMITHAGDTSNLILDPDLDSYYLMDVTLLALPQMQDRMQDMVAFVEQLSKKKEISHDDRIKLNVYAALLKESDWDRITAGIQTSLNEDKNFNGVSPSLAGALQPPIDAQKPLVEDLLARLKVLADAKDPSAFDMAPFRKTSMAILDALYAYHWVAFDEEDKLLRIRIAGFEADKTKSLWMTGAAVLVASALAFVVARSIASRVAKIADVTTKVAGGDLDVRVGEMGSDELGQLAVSFDKMTEQVQKRELEIVELNHGLEAKVAERTAELSERNNAIQRILDNADQGFITIDTKGVLAAERSAKVDTWFGTPKDGAIIWQYLETRSPEFAAQFQMSFGEVVEDIMPLEVTLDQMPKRMTVGTAVYRFEYRPIVRDEVLQSLLVVISDITAEVERQKAEAEQQETLRIFDAIRRDKSGFIEFFTEARDLVHRVTADYDQFSLTQIKRFIHTLKGNCGIFGITTVADYCHDLETRIQDIGDTLSEADLRRLSEIWDATSASISNLLGDQETSRVEVDDDEYAAILQAVSRGRPRREVISLIAQWKMERSRVRLERIAEQARQLASRLGKGQVDVAIEHGDVRMPRDIFAGFWGTFAHVVRNSVDHGLETPEERRAVPSKPERPTVTLRTEVVDNTFLIEIRDDGRGIDWDKVRSKAKALGMPTSSHEYLVEAIFSDGFSTKDDVTDVSGRGVGLGAVREACSALGGTIEIDTQRHEGTTIRFKFPKSVLSERHVPEVADLPLTRSLSVMPPGILTR